MVVDERYRTPEEHYSAMEPHSATAWWDGERLEAVDSNQGPFTVAAVLATLFSLTPEQVRIRAEHVGGGFGSKGQCGPQLILAVMGTMQFGRPVRVTLTRNQVFLMTPPRPATDQRVRLGADADGRLRAIDHEAAFSLSPLAEYVENCTEITKSLYAAPAIRTATHRRAARCPADVRGPRTRHDARLLRARVRHRRVGGAAGHGPARAAAAQRTLRRTRVRAAVQQPQPRRVPS